MYSGINPGSWLLWKNTGASGNALVCTVKSPLPVRSYNSKCMAAGELVTVNRKKLVKAAPGPAVKVKGMLFVKLMTVGVGVSSSLASTL